jgi:hypothetical protein
VSAPTPLLDFIRRGQAAHDVRLMAARGALAPRAHEQLAILVHLIDDPDPQIREAATDTLNRIPEASLTAYLARSDVPIGVREFFADRGVFPAETPALEIDDPLIDTALPVDPVGDTGEDAEREGGDGGGEREAVAQQIARMSFTERMLAALKGSREMRAILIRDPNKAIAATVLSCPKVNDGEVETFARMTTVSEDVLRIIGSNRAWVKNYGIVVGLTKNPKTPLALSLNLMNRLNDRDMNLLSIDRNVPEPLRVAARRRVVDAVSRR